MYYNSKINGSFEFYDQNYDFKRDLIQAEFTYKATATGGNGFSAQKGASYPGLTKFFKTSTIEAEYEGISL